MTDDNLAYTLSGLRKNSPYDRKRRLAEQMMMTGADYSPVQHPLQGAARLAQALVGGWMANRADGDEKKANDDLAKKIADAGSITDPQERIKAYSAIDQGIGLRAGAQLAVEQAKQAQTLQQRQSQAGEWATANGAPGGGQIQTGGLPAPQRGGQATATPNPGDAASRIAGIESAGQPNGGYGAVGPVANKQGNRAYGKYQVLDTNIGPWTQEVLGKAMSPQEFLANPQAQDAVFQAKFGQYQQKYGPEGASRAWFAGEGGMNSPGASDVNGMTVQRYAQKFLQGGQQGQQGPQIAQGSSPQVAPGMPPQDFQTMQPGAAQNVPGVLPQMPPGQMPPGMPPQPSPQGPGSAVVAQPTLADVPRPQPDAQTVARLRQMIATGQMTPQQAEVELQGQVDRQWGVQRDRAKADYDLKLGDYREGQKRQGDLAAKAPLEMIQQRTKNYEETIRPKAEAAASEITAMHQMRQLLDAGAITGTGAEARMAAQKFAQTIGIPWGNDQVANTAALQSAVGQRVLALVKNLGAGSGISNADREYAAKIAGGEIGMTEESMRRIMDIGERSARNTLKNHDAEVTRLMKLPGVSTLGPDYFSVQTPSNYAEWSKTNPLVQPQPAQGPGPMPGAQQQAPQQQPQQQGGEPPMLTSPEQAKGMPSGTVFRTPDGRLKRVP